MSVDRERLESLFADPALGWIGERLRRRVERGESFAGEVTGTLSLGTPSSAERVALDRLLGRPPSRGRGLSLRLAELERILRRAAIADSLAEAVAVLCAPEAARREKEEERERRWENLWSELAARDPRPEIHEWLAARRTRILARRYARHDPEQGRRLLERTFGVISRLPARGVPLPELAATVLGDSHALDAGQRVGSLVISAASLLGGVDDWSHAAARRDVWASVGVLLDELSAPVLVLNLPASPENLTGRTLAQHAAAGEPCRLSTRQLLRDPPTLEPPGTVFVCENPAVVAAAAHRLGAASAPLVCVEGQPATAVRILLSRLADLGTRLLYHSDFDWGGVRIANLVMERHGALPWCFGAADYRRAIEAGKRGKKLEGRPVEAAWDGELALAMQKLGRAVHEEEVLEELLADLLTPSSPHRRDP